MAIQTEIGLQPDYMCYLRVMGKQSRIAETVILSPSVPDSHSLRTYPKVIFISVIFIQIIECSDISDMIHNGIIYSSM